VAGLYLHIPFRRSSHAYDESFAVDVETADVDRFVAALRRELRLYAGEYAEEEPIRTVYIGGGRPSLLSREHVRSVLATLNECADVSAVEEVTIEVHPSDAGEAPLQALRQMGIERVSLGALSFFPADLRAIEAAHSAEQVTRAFRNLRAAGFQNVSVDLLFGWPDQTQSQWKAVLDRAVELNLPHVTLLEASSAAGTVASDDVLAHRLEYAMTYLQSEGYAQYELTHFARPEAQSVHQVHYYAHENQLGLGPSAESFWWGHRGRALARRWTNVSDLERYVTLLRDRYPPVAFRQTLDRSALATEYVLLRLRTSDGLNLDHLQARYGLDLPETKASLLDRLQSEGLAEIESGHLRLTNRGRLVADAITEKLTEAL
jgi:oxygen-independent coproporphyrinogen-3 oxidase